jgi:hypothetical protein
MLTISANSTLLSSMAPLAVLAVFEEPIRAGAA